MPAPAGLALAVHRLPADDPSRPLRLRYVVADDPAAVRWPPALAAGEEPRRDGLWRHTCFEAFVAAPAGHGSGYVEYNFAPSGAWAIYRFDGYRQGMRPEPAPVAPRIVVTRAAAGTTAIDVAAAWPSDVATEVADVAVAVVGTVTGATSTATSTAAVAATTATVVTAAATAAADPPGAAPAAGVLRIRLGLSSVLEAADGSLSYWALHHPSARPDFHNEGGFMLELEVPG
ncbi:MAG: DOMON-like domain-containing protein [Gammaproteobacteria bacterium]|nr:DOMON-like domain-containing protein [Gammaproteobacteria bacterium]